MSDSGFAVKTVAVRLRELASATPAAPAILAPGQPTLSFSRLVEEMDRFSGALSEAGVPSGARVATLLSDGPRTAVASLTLICSRVLVPLNPAATQAEVAREVSRSGAVAIVTEGLNGSSIGHPAHATSGVPILELMPPADDSSWPLRISGTDDRDVARAIPRADASDQALLMFTSGTTSEPRMVPLTNENICSSAHHIIDHFRLTADDRRLNVMPLFHVQGLVGGLVAPLLAGGSVICTGGFRPDRFLEWLEDFAPTWYSAVPTMHRQIIDAVRRLDSFEAPPSLRFIRNGSSPVRRETLAEVEALFGVPLLESYGMTETASQISCNPLPPADRKPGSAGRPSGPEVRIVDERGIPVPGGESGLIIVRGPNVITAYEADDDANSAKFQSGWFKTGDIGRLDADGFLFIEGRSDDVVNRGGEKISPAEVELVIESHPDVVEAVVFGIPDKRLGEELAARIVAKPDVSPDMNGLVSYLGEHLSDHKVPRRIQFTADLPKGITGKVLREQAARSFDVQDRGRPDTATQPSQSENVVREVWSGLLNATATSIGVDDDFFDLGGYSLLAIELVERVAERTGRRIPLAALFPEFTISSMSRILDSPQSPVTDFEPLVVFRSSGSQPPLFCVHPAGGSVIGYASLARALHQEQPVYGIQAPGLEGIPAESQSVEEMASRYLDIIKEAQPAGPYRLLGYSLGGIICFELAARLIDRGETVEFLGIVDSFCPSARFERPHEESFGAFMTSLESIDLSETDDPDVSRRLWGDLGGLLSTGEESSAEDGLAFLFAAINQRALFLEYMRAFGLLGTDEDRDDESLRRFLRSLRAGFRAAVDYLPSPISQTVDYFRVGDELPADCQDEALGWGDFADEVRVTSIEGDHFTLLTEQHTPAFAASVQGVLDRVNISEDSNGEIEPSIVPEV